MGDALAFFGSSACEVDAACTAAIVIPCFNEARRLQPSELLRCVDAHPDFRFVLVDDASEDDTVAVLSQLVSARPGRFELLRMPRNAGQGEAVRAGVLHALARGCGFVGYWDADLAAPLSELPRFVAALEADRRCLCVYGSRVRMLGSEIQRTPLRYYLGRLFAVTAAHLLELDVYDTQCGAKLFRATPETASLFRQRFRTRWLFDVELLARLILLRGSPRATLGLVRELPLLAWHEVPGSKLRIGDFVLAPLQLARIHLDLQRGLQPRFRALEPALPPRAEFEGSRDP